MPIKYGLNSQIIEILNNELTKKSTLRLVIIRKLYTCHMRTITESKMQRGKKSWTRAKYKWRRFSSFLKHENQYITMCRHDHEYFVGSKLYQFQNEVNGSEAGIYVYSFYDVWTFQGWLLVQYYSRLNHPDLASWTSSSLSTKTTSESTTAKSSKLWKTCTAHVLYPIFKEKQIKHGLR